MGGTIPAGSARGVTAAAVRATIGSSRSGRSIGSARFTTSAPSMITGSRWAPFGSASRDARRRSSVLSPAPRVAVTRSITGRSESSMRSAIPCAQGAPRGPGVPSASTSTLRGSSGASGSSGLHAL